MEHIVSSSEFDRAESESHQTPYEASVRCTGILLSSSSEYSIKLRDTKIVNVQCDNFFEFNMCPSRGHQYKLYKNRSVSRVRAAFFSERVVNVCNSLPDSVDFSTLSKFRRSIMCIDFSKFLKYF